MNEEDESILNHDGVNTWYFESSISLNFLNGSVVSIIENTYSYTGGAHGYANIMGYNFYISPSYKFELKDLFFYNDYQKVLDFISEFCFLQLRHIYNEWSETSEVEIQAQDKTMFWENSLDSNWENYSNFLMGKDVLSIIFNQYQVSSYAFGSHIISIPIKKLMELEINTDILNAFEKRLA